MIIGLVTFEIHIPMAASLKEKRRSLNRLKARLKSRFNVSVAEVDDQDAWQRSALAAVHVGCSRGVVDSVLQHIVSCVEEERDIQLLNYRTELIT